MNQRRQTICGIAMACAAVVFALAAPLAAAPAPAPAGGKGDPAAAAASAGPSLAEATFTPGKETRVGDSSVGGVGYYLVWVPKEYSPDRTWPAVFCYHGINQKPTVWPFMQVLGGKGFIVIGLDYYGSGGEAYGTVSHDVENLRRLVPVLTNRLNLDPRQLFVGGFSQGAYMGSSISEATAELWAGIALMGGGRGSGGGVRNGAMYKGKPMYIAAGEKDPHRDDAVKASESYKKHGAEVTFETYEGLGHSVDTKSKVFADWLWATGPLKQVMADVAEAKKLQAAGTLGAAYTKFLQAAGVPGDHEACKEAAAASEAIAKEAEARLAAADEAVKAKRYKEGAAALSQVAAAFSGSKFGEQAARQLAAVKGDPTIQGEIETARQNEQAAAIMKQAQAAEQAKNFAAAMKLYEQVLATCPKSELVASAKARLEALKGDKAVQGAIMAKDAERECRSWLAMADNLIKADEAEKVREYLKKIIEKYPDTDWGRQARERLQKVK